MLDTVQLSCFGIKHLLSPEVFFTKICTVSSASADEAREKVEEMEEMLLERMLRMFVILMLSIRSCSGGVIKWQAVVGRGVAEK